MKPAALVVGDLSLVRALGRAGIPVVLATSSLDSSAAHSRYCVDSLLTPGFVDDPHAAVRAIVRWARAQTQKPVLYYQGDHDLVAFSRARAELTPHAHLLLPPADLVEQLVDKLEFARLTAERELPVPATLGLLREDISASLLADWHHYPCVLKPTMRTHWFGSRVQETSAGTSKAIHIARAEELVDLLPRLRGHTTDFVLQQAVAGGEEYIVSYHAYVRPGGEVVADFTGKKVRTSPMQYGLSTCVVITRDEEVARLGRAVLEKLRFFGVAKLDFKRDSQTGQLFLLEVNPRYNLWHHPGAVAGVNLPALVYRDALRPGSAARVLRPAQTGVRWMSLRTDLRAMLEYRAAGRERVGRWLWQWLTADIIEDFSLRDPAPSLVEALATMRRKLVLRRLPWRRQGKLAPTLAER